MKKEGVKQYILGSMYAERLKSALIIAGQLLNGLKELDEKERSAGLKIFAFAGRAMVFLEEASLL